MEKLTRGFLITIEGIDGSGKSTLAHNLFQALVHKQLPAMLTKEPGSTNLGMLIRQIVHEGAVQISPKAEYLLFAADRAQHFAQIIMPNLVRNKIIISDRMADSSLVYQGFGRKLGTQEILYINRWTMENRTPDLTFFLDVDPKVAHKRIVQRNQELTSFEQEDTSFFETLAHGFKQIFKDRTNVITLNGNVAPEELTQQAISASLKVIAPAQRWT